MFDSIFIGTTGLLNHAKGLRVVGNNLANVNTPGFKSSAMQFTNMFEQGSGNTQLSSGYGNGSGMGTGLSTLGTQISFRAGLDQATGNPLDLNINGNGFFAIKRDGELMYTRSGDFRFDTDGILVNSQGDQVMGLDENGQLNTISVETLGRSLPKTTTNVVFGGVLSSTVTTAPVPFNVNGVTVIDPEGVNRPLNIRFTNAGAGTYSVAVTTEAGAAVATGSIQFTAGAPVAGSDSISFSYTPAGGTAFDVKLDFSKNVSSAPGSSTLSFRSQDGYAVGVKTDQTIQADGTLKIQYSNGQTALGQRIALADFQTDQALIESGGGAFKKVDGETVEYGYATVGSFGNFVAGHREGSNVDLAEEFGNLILMQRGYQAASHVVSTANDMIQQLFDMKGR